MPTYLAPGTYVEELSSGVKPIAGVSTSVAAFVGLAPKGRLNHATLLTSFADFVKRFGGPIRVIEDQQEIYLYYAVRHFFAQGGSRCYVVRVAGAAAAVATGASGALTVTAISPGDWGESLTFDVTPTSQYSHLLAADAASGTTTVDLAENTDVRVGSLLLLVNEATGTVQGVSTLDVTFEIDIINRNDGTPTNFTIPNGVRAYAPELDLETTVNVPGGVNVTPGTAATVTLASVTKADGSTLRPGDVVNFALDEHASPVTKVNEALVAGSPATQAGIAATAVAFPANVSRVYERGFTLTVKETVGTETQVVEEHERLSLVATDRINHVAVRLPAEVHPIEIGRSFYVSAIGTSTALVPRATNVALTTGDDGLPSPAAGANLDPLVIGDPVLGTGLFALDGAKDASILCVTHASTTTTNQAIAYCEGRKDLVFVIDPPRTEASVTAVTAHKAGLNATTYAGIYFPWIRIDDPLAPRKISVPPSGAVAGLFARSDNKRGVHKAPAGIDVGSVGVASGTALVLTKADNDVLHAAQVNAIRNTPEGILVWGARTISSDPEWIYMNVRRLFIFLEQSIERGTQWTAFEPNDESLWGRLRRNISAFLRIQWLEGKLVGATEEEAFYVKCDAETNPPEIVDAGIVVTEIGVAPSKPAEFVVFRINQLAGGESGT